jgi:hypothetical protein
MYAAIYAITISSVSAMMPPSGASSSSIAGSMSGDGVPAGYSVINIDLDTVDGPTILSPSVVGYVRNIDMEMTSAENTLLRTVIQLAKKTQRSVESAIDRSKLVRRGYIPSSFLTFGRSGSEPNYGPFPQYNIIFEDEPIDDYFDSISRQKRPRYRSRISKDLDEILKKTGQLYERLRTAVSGPLVSNPMKSKSTSSFANNSLVSSFYEDHEQFIERNTLPFQEITIHAESAVPAGGDAPAMPKAAMRLLDLNRTVDRMTDKLLEAEEQALLKQLLALFQMSKKR